MGSQVSEEACGRAERYRRQAIEIRAAAEKVTHAQSRAALLRLADTYEKLADRIDEEGAPTHNK